MSANDRILKVLSIGFDYFLTPAVGPDAYSPFKDTSDADTEPGSLWLPIYANAALSGTPMENLFTCNMDTLQRVAETVYESRACSYELAMSHADIRASILNMAPLYSGGVKVWHLGRFHGSSTKSPLASWPHNDDWLAHLYNTGTVLSARWTPPAYVDDHPEDLDPRVVVDHNLDDVLDAGPFDFIYIARHGAFMPPHLDALFDQFFCSPLLNASPALPVRANRRVLSSRDTPDFRKDLAVEIERRTPRVG